MPRNVPSNTHPGIATVTRLVLLGLLLWCGAASAQQPQSSCTYETCALRVVDGGGYFAPQVVVRGSEGYSVALARRSETLENVFAVNDSAAAYYARFETRERYADWSGWIGTGLMLAGFIFDIAGEGGFFSRSFFLYGGGLAVTYGVAMPLQGRAGTDLSNAIWWYNRSLLSSP